MYDWQGDYCFVLPFCFKIDSWLKAFSLLVRPHPSQRGVRGAPTCSVVAIAFTCVVKVRTLLFLQARSVKSYQQNGFYRSCSGNVELGSFGMYLRRTGCTLPYGDVRRPHGIHRALPRKWNPKQKVWKDSVTFHLILPPLLLPLCSLYERTRTWKD